MTVTSAQQYLCALLALGPRGNFIFFLIQELGWFLAACGIPQQWGVGTPHLHLGYTALAK